MNSKKLQSKQFEDALFAQAFAYHRAGQLRDAEAGYRQVLAANSRHPGALGCLGILAHQSGHSADGIDLLKKAVASDKRNAELHYNLACVLADCGHDQESIRHNRKALELQPDYPGAHNNLAALLLLQGHVTEALKIVVQGLQLGVTPALKSTFVMVLRPLDPSSIKFDRNMVQLLSRALIESWCRPRDVSGVVCALLVRMPAFGRSLERSLTSTPSHLNDLFNTDELASIAVDGLLQALLVACPVTNIALERVLTKTRAALLDEVSNGKLEAFDEWLPLSAAIAQQCYINEYVFDVSDREESQIVNLRDAIVDALDADKVVAPIQIAALASYMPLHSLSGADRLLQAAWPDDLQSVIKQQISEWVEEQGIRGQIEKLTAVEDIVSEKVRDQYEENPYPRWTRIPADKEAMPIDQYLRAHLPGVAYQAIGDRPISVLIAGCGTGMHAIHRAQQFRNADVLAIDLSLSSLSYAVRKTQELGLKNIRYGQADILAFKPNTMFDVIDSSGVLHHLGDPLEGWRNLASLLRPGGLMHIGLYSAIARKNINLARDFLTSEGRDYSVAEVRRLRAQVAGLQQDPKFKNITEFSDFFSASECRDLLFHVQEHQFSIPHIAAFLTEAGFKFLGFETPHRRRYLKRFPEDTAAVNLDNWHVFETENPEIFIGMYQFWIQKA
ncbi:SAM-dependent methyltransferase [Nitrobacteraceae bacterium AZCC 1564]